MPACPTCGKQLEPTARFCPDDGTPLTETAAATVPQTPTGRPAPSKELELPLLINSRYRLEEARGGGGMAKVYRAVDVTLEREVAVKLINPELRAEPEFDARFQREARIASQLADPHIVVVHDFGLDATHGPYLVMEYLLGQSLREHLQAHGPLPLRAVLQLSAQLLLALIHAHEKGIIHRDIKPDNVFLLNQSGVRLHVRVLDFGIARIYRRDEPAPAETLTKPGAVLGTPRYMSPEQLAGQPLDARSDLYSAALVIFEALTRSLPYVSNKRLSELCPEAPAAFQQVLEQCLKQNPDERPASAVEVYLRLQEPAKASGILLLPPGAMDKLAAASKQQQSTLTYVPGEGRRPWWRRRALGAIAVVLMLGIVTWGVFALLHGPPTQPTPPKESLLGFQIGQSRDEVVGRLHDQFQKAHGPEFMKETEESLGEIIRPGSLGDEAGLVGLDVLVWSQGQVAVVFAGDVVRSVLLRDSPKERVGSGRGVKLGASKARLDELYEEVAVERPLSSHAAVRRGAGKQAHVRGKIYRYDSLGIGFEVQNDKVTAIALYPPQ